MSGTLRQRVHAAAGAEGLASADAGPEANAVGDAPPSPAAGATADAEPGAAAAAGAEIELGAVVAADGGAAAFGAAAAGDSGAAVAAVGIAASSSSSSLIPTGASWQGPLPIADALALGEQVARSLAALHAHGLVHGALRPQAVAWRAGEGRFELKGAAAVPAGEEGQRLVYVSPEQTGRLEAAVDARSDLYSLGVLLYEALVGEPPFVGRDALEQLHWHVAGTALAPARRRPEVPAPLSDLVLQLLAKAPDERYQTALGLAHDLAHCAAQWHERRRIEPFARRRRDRGAQLVRGGARLVGRSREAAALLAAFERCCRGGRALVLVRGHAGVGKTALIRQLVRPIVRQRGHFISGKFDQVVRGLPFGALIQAFQGLVRHLLGESEPQLARWRERLVEALGANAGVLTEVIPEIEFIIGAQPPAPALDGAEAQNRFRRVLERFVAALAPPERPLVLFLDDVQWADAATLALLEPLATSPEIGGLLLLLACRDDEARAAARLAPTLQTLLALPPAQAAVEQLVLAPLAATDLALLVGDALQIGADEAAPLARLVHAKTAGNPFFAMQFLRLLQREGQLRFDEAALRWQWDLERIERTPLADDVVELVTGRIQRLSAGAQQVLTLAACIGNAFDVEALATVCTRQPAAAIEGHLALAQGEGLIVPAPPTAEGRERFAFLHDRVQQAAYALIPPDERRGVHLEVGRLQRARAGTGVPADAELYELVHHLNLGRALITEAAERREVAELDLGAGRRAKSATAFEAALELFAAGLELLGGLGEHGDPGAAGEPRLAFELALELAECRYLCGQFDVAMAAFGALAGKAPTLLDRARVVRLRCVQYANMARHADALAGAREVLVALGVRLPDDATGKAAALDTELAAIDRLRAGRPVPSLVELPPMHDATTRMAMALLTDIWSSAYITGDTTLARLLSATLVRLSLEHGHTGESAYGYVTHAITVGALLGDYRTADEFGRLALEVNRRLDDRRRRAMVFQQFHAHVNFWCHPLRTCVAYAREACSAGLDSGDFLYASYAAGTGPWAAFAAAQDLAAFERDYTPSVALIERLQNPAFADQLRLLLAAARALQGRTAAPLLLSAPQGAPGRPQPPGDPQGGVPAPSGAGFDEAAWVATYGEVRFFAAIHAVLKLQLAVLMGSAADALAAAQRGEAVIDALPGTIWPVLFEFWQALALARAVDAGASDGVGASGGAPDPAVVGAAALERIARAQVAFAARVQHDAENFLPPSLLLAAELAALQGRAAEALRYAEQAAEFTATAPLRPLQALAHETLARLHRRLAQPVLADMHTERARELYRAWGALAKVAQLGAAMLAHAGAAPAAATPTANSAPQVAVTPAAGSAAAATALPEASASVSAGAARDPGHLDLASVLKAAQAIAAEHETEALLARLLHIAIENAGAERGALVLDGDQGPVVHSVEAAGAAPLQEALEHSRRVPSSIVHYVRRTGETVVWATGHRAAGGARGTGAAQERGEAGDGALPLHDVDPYLRRHAPRSLACLPVRRQAQAVGVLYVEHRRAASVFTEARLATLHALATQAAISLENARLVGGLRAEVDERRRAQERLAQALAEVRTLKDELEAENSALRRDLIANVSHDLRTPLVSLRGYLDVLQAKGEALPPVQRQQYLGIALRQSERLATLIDELFELAKLDFKGLALKRERFAFGELAGDVLQKFQLSAASRGVRLELDAGAEAGARLPPLDADLGLVERVLENLIGNALKHTPAGGNVCLRMRAQGGRLQVDVRDSGAGIAAADLPHIFERFYRGAGGGGAGAASAEGAGLGLAIARRIVELHGGEVAAASRPGEGATLSFSLPVAAPGP